MKGYFSQLAKQSGLRYAKKNTVSSFSDVKKEIAPLDREEIVLVSSGAAKTEAPEAVKIFSPQKNESQVQNSGEIVKNDSVKPSLPPEKSDAAMRQNVSAIKEPGEIFAESSLFEFEKENSAKLSEVEQFVFKENETAEIVDKSEDKSVEEKFVQPEFFSKTAEILESGNTDKLKVQQILLQEINEWVSAAPAPDDSENEFITGKKVHPIFPQTVKDMSDRRESSENSDNLQEQNFNLSIGTITVVVEEPNVQAPIAAQNQSRIAEKREPEKGGTTSLSRCYL